MTHKRNHTSSEEEKKKERVCIIGAGWYGCHIALQLKKQGYEVVIYEKERDIFLGASGFNQFRLHKGLHYPRSYVTRMQSLKGFDHFMKHYGQLTTQVDYNLYAVANKNSWLDFGTYKQVMDQSKIYNKPFNHHHFGLINLEGSLLCNERVLYHAAPRAFFRSQFEEGTELLLNTPVKKAEEFTITSFVAPQFDEEDDLTIRTQPLEEEESSYDSLSDSEDELEQQFSKIKINNKEEFDWCISCTYCSFLVTPSLNIFYEPCLTLIYRDVRSDPFPRMAMTICDGQFCSLFPYISGPEEEKLIAKKYHESSDLGVLAQHAPQEVSQQDSYKEDMAAISSSPTTTEDNVNILYTLTSVAHTPLGQFNSWKRAEEHRLRVHNNPDTEVKKLIPLFEQNIIQFYPAFKQHFVYHSYFTSMKTKPYDATDSRECTVEREGRFISVMSGKVNSLHVAESEILKILKEPRKKKF